MAAAPPAGTIAVTALSAQSVEPALNEPIVQYGPFVMNSVAEIEQAIQDYQQGRLTEGAAKVLQI